MGFEGWGRGLGEKGMGTKPEGWGGAPGLGNGVRTQIRLHIRASASVPTEGAGSLAGILWGDLWGILGGDSWGGSLGGIPGGSLGDPWGASLGGSLGRSCGGVIPLQDPWGRILLGGIHGVIHGRTSFSDSVFPYVSACDNHLVPYVEQLDSSFSDHGSFWESSSFRGSCEPCYDAMSSLPPPPPLPPPSSAVLSITVLKPSDKRGISAAQTVRGLCSDNWKRQQRTDSQRFTFVRLE